jgi:hypothetical protein
MDIHSTMFLQSSVRLSVDIDMTIVSVFLYFCYSLTVFVVHQSKSCLTVWVKLHNQSNCHKSPVPSRSESRKVCPLQFILFHKEMELWIIIDYVIELPNNLELDSFQNGDETLMRLKNTFTESETYGFITYQVRNQGRIRFSFIRCNKSRNTDISWSNRVVNSISNTYLLSCRIVHSLTWLGNATQCNWSKDSGGTAVNHSTSSFNKINWNES